MRPILLLAILTLLVTCSCVKNYEMDLPLTDQRLVLEGVYSNEIKTNTFILSKTSKYHYKYDSAKYQYEQGALLIISDDAGTIDTLKETAPGRYNTNPSKMYGITGHSYKLDIFTKAGKHYQSNWQKMLPVPVIDSLYFERDVTDRSTTAIGAYKNNVFIDWRNPKDTNNLIMMYVTYFWNNAWQDKFRWPRVINDMNLTSNVFYKYPVYSGYDGKSFTIKIYFYSLTKENYDYLNVLFQQRNPGEDFDVNVSTPLIGNIYNSTNTKDYILGFFQVSASSSKQVYVDH
jgi:hypothetical protein